MATAQNLAIEVLVTQITELEQKANDLRVAVNYLCEKDGVPPMFPFDGGGGGKNNGEGDRVPDGNETPFVPPQIKSDTFYGKKQQTAVREYLMIRKANNEGPAKPGDILAGLKAGGYQVEAKTDDIALVGLRAMLRKASTVFHKLPNGTWGLKEWYPHAKAHKDAAPKETATKAAQATPAEAFAGVVVEPPEGAMKDDVSQVA